VHRRARQRPEFGCGAGNRTTPSRAGRCGGARRRRAGRPPVRVSTRIGPGFPFSDAAVICGKPETSRRMAPDPSGSSLVCGQRMLPGRNKSSAISRRATQSCSPAKGHRPQPRFQERRRALARPGQDRRVHAVRPKSAGLSPAGLAVLAAIRSSAMSAFTLSSSDGVGEVARSREGGFYGG
jgi:hypothetical protein